MRWRARSSSPARPSSGCATGCGSSATPRRPPRSRATVPDSHGVYMVPAFVGLGAPHWDAGCARPDLRPHARCHRRAPGARGARVGGLPDARPRRGDGRDGARRAAAIRVDGGMAANDWFCQFLADMLEARVERPAELETTALGAAFLAGLATGVWPNLQALAATWKAAAVFTPRMDAPRRAGKPGRLEAPPRRTLEADPPLKNPTRLRPAIVGGGIHGACIARDAPAAAFRHARRTRRPRGATSSASSKLVHGGLRYLEHLRPAPGARVPHGARASSSPPPRTS